MHTCWHGLHMFVQKLLSQHDPKNVTKESYVLQWKQKNLSICLQELTRAISSENFKTWCLKVTVHPKNPFVISNPCEFRKNNRIATAPFDLHLFFIQTTEVNQCRSSSVKNILQNIFTWVWNVDRIFDIKSTYYLKFWPMVSWRSIWD